CRWQTTQGRSGVTPSLRTGREVSARRDAEASSRRPFPSPPPPLPHRPARAMATIVRAERRPMGLVLTDEIVDLVNGALASGNAMLLAAITVEGKPRMSYRGSLQALSGDQLSFWVRRVEGATLEGIKVNPEVAL